MDPDYSLRRTHVFFRIVPQLFLFATFTIGQNLFAQTRIVPDDGWVQTYFQSIDKLTSRFGLEPLRSLEIKPNDLEVRIWRWSLGYGGSVIKRVGNKWSAVSLFDPQGTIGINGSPVQPSRQSGPRGTDWALVWEELEQAGIIDIQDDTEIPHCQMILDGASYVVEIAKNNYYRTYNLNNPELRRSENGDRFLRVMSIVREAFGGTAPDALSKLPSGEERIVASFSSDIPASGDPPGMRHDGSEYKVGNIPPENAIIRLSRKEGLAQAVTLSIRQCQDLPPPRRYISPYMSGDVVMEVYIQPDGSVSAARALLGPVLLVEESLQSAIKWQFLPLAGSVKIRSVIVHIRFEKKWVRFPWIQ